MSAITEPEFLTVKEAAARLSLSVSGIWKLIARGDLPSVKLGGSRLIPTAALDELRAIAGPVPAERIKGQELPSKPVSNDWQAKLDTQLAGNSARTKKRP